MGPVSLDFDHSRPQQTDTFLHHRVDPWYWRMYISLYTPLTSLSFSGICSSVCFTSSRDNLLGQQGDTFSNTVSATSLVYCKRHCVRELVVVMHTSHHYWQDERFCVWKVSQVFVFPRSRLTQLDIFSRRENVGVPKTTLFSLTIICVAIFLFIPWQVAYLGCWLLHLYTCASSIQQQANLGQQTDAVPLVDRSGRRHDMEYQGDRTPDIRHIKQNNLNHNLHLLLLMTWLLPLTAPVLAVWVRTLLTAGYTTPFDGDHNFFAVLPFLVLADFASWTPEKLFDRTR